MPHNKILIVTIPEKGHINPMIGIAQQLLKQNIEIAFFAQADISAQLKQANLNVPMFFPDEPSERNPEFVTKGREFVEKLQDKSWLQKWIKTLLIDVVPGQVKSLQKVLKNYKPDIIVTDPMVYAAVIVAEKYGIPWAGVSSSLNPVTPDGWACDLTETLNLFSSEREKLFDDFKKKPRFKVSDAISPWLNIVFTTEEYIPRSLSNNNFSFYVGHAFPQSSRGDEQGFPFHLLKKEKKKVYMSLGSQVYYHPHLFETVQEAFKGTDVQLIFSINELLNTSFKEKLYENVIAVSYAPQLQILPHVDLMISHGGANSVMECLAHGKPIALMPICNDQFLQAGFVRLSKVGLVLDVQKPSVEEYRARLFHLLEPTAEERNNAAAIGRSFSNYDGPSQAADLIRQLVGTRKPLMPECHA